MDPHLCSNRSSDAGGGSGCHGWSAIRADAQKPLPAPTPTHTTSATARAGATPTGPGPGFPRSPHSIDIGDPRGSRLKVRDRRREHPRRVVPMSFGVDGDSGRRRRRPRAVGRDAMGHLNLVGALESSQRQHDNRWPLDGDGDPGQRIREILLDYGVQFGIGQRHAMGTTRSDCTSLNLADDPASGSAGASAEHGY